MSAYLAVDTATEACSVAIAIDGVMRERFEPMQREHTQRLLPMIEAVLAEAGLAIGQLDGLACGIGPGSFAGLRIGLGVVKGIALARDLPVVGVSSLAMLAQRPMRLGGATRVACVIDARMSEVYVGAFLRGADGLAASALSEQVCAPGAVPALPAGSWIGVGTGWGRYESELRGAMGGTVSALDATALPHAEDALVLALPQFHAGKATSADALTPAYLRNNVALTLTEQQALRARNKEGA